MSFVPAVLYSLFRFWKRGGEIYLIFYLVGNKNQIKLNFNKFTVVSCCSCYIYSTAEIRLT